MQDEKFTWKLVFIVDVLFLVFAELADFSGQTIPCNQIVVHFTSLWQRWLTSVPTKSYKLGKFIRNIGRARPTIWNSLPT